MRVPASLFVFERVRVRCSFRRFVQARVCANVSERVARRVGWLVRDLPCVLVVFRSISSSSVTLWSCTVESSDRRRDLQL